VVDRAFEEEAELHIVAPGSAPGFVIPVVAGITPENVLQAAEAPFVANAYEFLFIPGISVVLDDAAEVGVDVFDGFTKIGEALIGVQSQGAALAVQDLL